MRQLAIIIIILLNTVSLFSEEFVIDEDKYIFVTEEDRSFIKNTDSGEIIEFAKEWLLQKEDDPVSMGGNSGLIYFDEKISSFKISEGLVAFHLSSYFGGKAIGNSYDLFLVYDLVQKKIYKGWGDNSVTEYNFGSRRAGFATQSVDFYFSDINDDNYIDLFVEVYRNNAAYKFLNRSKRKARMISKIKNKPVEKSRELTTSWYVFSKDSNNWKINKNLSKTNIKKIAK